MNTLAQDAKVSEKAGANVQAEVIPRRRGRPVGSTNKASAEKKGDRDLDGLENKFKEVMINSGMVFVTVGEDIKKFKRELVSEFGPTRRNARTNVDKQAIDLTLKRLRQMFGLHGRHLTLKFIEEHDDKLIDESGKEVIHYMPRVGSQAN